MSHHQTRQGWPVVPIKYVASCNDDVLSEATNPDRPVKYVDIGNVQHGVGITGYENLPFSSAPSRARRLVRDGDVIVSTVRTYLRAIALVENSDDKTVVSTGFAVLRPGRDLSSRFFGYAMQSENLIDEIVSRSVGVSYPGIAPTELTQIPIPVPPLDTQLKVADFLDHETIEADALMAKYERLLELLEEKRVALITQAVTKGLDPNVPMKDSGIEWIGQTPAHWSVGRLAPSIVSKTDGPFGSGLKNEHYAESGVRVIRLQNIGDGEFKGDDAAFVSEEYFKSLGGHDAKPGDVLVAGLGDENNALGRACLLPADVPIAMVKADCFRYRFNPERVSHEYIVKSINSAVGRNAALLASRGATRQRINLSAVGNMIVPLPPLPEQMEVSTFVDRLVIEIHRARKAIRAAIALVKERRAALITAAVTGQIDVTTYKPSTTMEVA